MSLLPSLSWKAFGISSEYTEHVSGGHCYPHFMCGRYFQHGTKQEIAEYVHARRITAETIVECPIFCAVG